ncbi:hypothetical protein QZH41_015435, partial [Actinostola sp. cb2023]
MLQDVAFGTKTMKLDSGERIVIPAVIRTLIPSRIIEQYSAYCRQIDFEPASERSLFRMIDVCSASMQTSLQGLDNVTAEGSEAFQNMATIVQSLQESGTSSQWVEDTHKALKEAKRYLKTDFKVHVGRDEDCSDHCTVHALSDPSDNATEFRDDCMHNHSFKCERCEMLQNVLTEIVKEVEVADMSDEHRARMTFDYQESVNRINAWKAHLLRSLNQEEGKQDALSQLDDETWAMKFLPHHYREQMTTTELTKIGARTEIKILRYAFSDPQAGKDICDRKTAPMKAHIKRWANEGHDVLTAEDMKQAIESHGGLKGCRAAVVEVDTSKEIVKENKITGISLLNNFSFSEATGIRTWRAYDIGPGRLMTYSDLQTVTQGDTGLKLVQPFGTLIKEKGSVGESKRPNADIYSCQESGCVLTFRTQREAETHMNTGKHRCELEPESLYDSIRKKWANRVTGITTAGKHHQAVASVPEHQPCSSSAVGRSQSWALKRTKKASRMTDKAKAFLVDKFDQGTRSGLKADPIQISKEMKLIKDSTEKLMFTPEEWRTGQQISQLFSRLAAAQKQHQSDEDIADEDVAAVESELALASLRNTVLQQVATPEHPIK